MLVFGETPGWNIYCFFFTLILPISAIFFSYRFIDHKNKEPFRAILFAIGFSAFIFFIEFFLVKPSIGKLLGFYDTYLFVYFLTEEKDYLSSLSLAQNALILILSCLSKSITYGIGLKVLFTYLYRLGRRRWFAGRHSSSNGFLDEPVDYVLYTVIYFIILSFLDSLIHFRFDSSISSDKFSIFFLLLAYISIALIISFIWLKFKVIFKYESRKSGLIAHFDSGTIITKKRYIFGLVTNIELRSISCLFILLMVVQLPLVFNSIIIESISIFLSCIILLLLYQEIKAINRKNYIIVDREL